VRLQTVSEQRAFRSCPRYHHVRYGLGYRAIATAPALSFGRLVHVGLAAWLSAFSAHRLSAALTAVCEQVSLSADGCDAFELVKVQELLRGYDALWAPSELATIAVEAEFRAPMLNPLTGATSRTFEIGGAIDAILRDTALTKWICEHKTSSEDIAPGSEYWARLRIDSQVSTYMVGARALGHDVAGCIYDVIGKPRIKPLLATPPDARKYTKAGTLYANQREVDETADEYRARLREEIATNPERYYQRGEVVRTDEDERDAAYDTWATARSIREAELAQRWPRNPESCVKWGRRCEFFDCCCHAADLEDTTRFRKAEKQHEELKEVA